MSRTPPGPARRVQARVRFSDDKNLLTVPDDRSGLRNIPPPSPAPAHMRRRKPVYRPVVHVLKVLVLCLVVAILVLLVIWAYHLVFRIPWPSSGVWKRDMLKTVSLVNIRTRVSLLPPHSSDRVGSTRIGRPDDLARQMLILD
jgi:hypothetical protein